MDAPAGRGKYRRSSASAGPDPAGLLVGRVAELDRLKDAIHRTKEGTGCVVLAHGPAGIGKTRLVEELAEYAVFAGCAAAWGRSSQERGAPPYWPWAQVLDTAADTRARRDAADLVASVFPGPGGARLAAPGLSSPAAADEGRFRLFDAVARLLVHAARRRPLLVILEDLHWADEPSLLLLRHVAEDTRGAPLMLLGTYRDREGGEALRETVAALARVRKFASSPVRGLSRGESQELLESVRGCAIPEELAEAAYRLTEGNPLHLRQIAFAVPEVPAAEGVGVDLVGGVREAVILRLGRLSSATRSVLAAAAVLGTEFSVAVLRRILPEPVGAFLGALLNEAHAEHFVRQAPGREGRQVFVHDLVREAVLDATSSVEKLGLHARCATVLTEVHGEDPQHAAELLRHCLAAQPLLGPGPAARYALLAGERALASYAYEDALAHFESGLRALEGLATDDRAAELLFGIARTRSLVSHTFESLPYFVRSFEHYERTGNLPGMVRVLTCKTMPGEAVLQPLYDRLLARVEQGSLDEARLRVFSETLRSAYGGELHFDDRLLRRIVTTARRHGDAELEMRALDYSTYGLWLNECGRAAEVLDRLVAAREIGRARGDVFSEFYCTGRIVDWLLYLGRGAEAEREAAQAMAAAERTEDRLALARASRAELSVAVHEARWDEAIGLCDRLREIAPPVQRQGGDDQVIRVLVRYQTGEVAAGAEDLAQLVERVERVPRVPADIFIGCCSAIVEAAYASGDSRSLAFAESTARMVLGFPQTSQNFKTYVRQILAMIAVLRHDRPEAEAQRKHFLGVVERCSEGDRPLLPWHRELGLLARTLGDLDGAAARLDRALARPGAAAYERAWCRHELAAALDERGGPGDEERATGLWRETLVECTHLGLKLLEPRVREQLESVDRGAATGPQAGDGVDALSARELEVLRLVVRGLTNREIGEKLFISTKTVDAHVRSILAKTGMANRTVAAAYAIRNALVQD